MPPAHPPTCHHAQVCPYYGSRRAVPGADVILAPYSAVLLPDARESLGIVLQDSVLVFDEAHNLLDAINSAHSTAVTGAAGQARGRLRLRAAVHVVRHSTHPRLTRSGFLSPCACSVAAAVCAAQLCRLL